MTTNVFSDLSTRGREYALLRFAVGDASAEESKLIEAAIRDDLDLANEVDILRAIHVDNLCDDQYLLEFFRVIQNSQSSCEVAQELATVLQRLGYGPLRAYVFDRTTQRLVGIEAVGHSDDVIRFLRAGNFERSKSEAATAHADTFICLESGEPIIVEVNQELAATSPYKLLTEIDGIRYFSGPEKCRLLASCRSRVHGDFPFPNHMGKVSVDITGNELSARNIRLAQHFVSIAGPRMFQLHFEAILRPLYEIKSLLHGAASLREIGRRMVSSECMSLLGFDDACFFSIRGNVEADRFAVLEASSEASAHSQIHLETYDLQKPGSDLIAWVGHYKRCAYLHMSNDDGDVQEQALALGLGFNAIERLSEYTKRTSTHDVVVVPVVDEKGDSLAIMCFRKHYHDECHEPARIVDVAVVQRVLRDALAHSISEILCRPVDIQDPSLWKLIAEVSLNDFLSFRELQHDLRKVFERMFDKLEGRHAAVLCLFGDDDSEGLQRNLLAGDLRCEQLNSEAFALEAAMVRGICASGQGSVVSTNGGSGQFQEIYSAFSSNAKCAIASCIALRSGSRPSRKRDFGALILLSDRFDLLHQTHGRILETVASRLAENLARRDIHNSLLAGFEYEFRGAHRRLLMHLDEIEKQFLSGRVNVQKSLPLIRRARSIAQSESRWINATSALSNPNAVKRTSGRQLNVHNEVALTFAHIPDDQSVRNQVDSSLCVVVPPSFRSGLAAILLKIATYAPRLKDNVSIVIEGRVISFAGGSALQLTVDGGDGPAFSADAGTYFSQSDALDNLLFESHRGKRTFQRVGCSMARSFAVRHSMCDGREGRLDVEPYQNGSRIAITLPVED